MFKHSTKVPRLYKVSANIAKDVKEGIGSIKNLVYEHKKKHPNVKAMYALVTTLFQKHDEIESLLKRAQFFTKEPRANPWLIKILMVELLWGKKRLVGDSVPEKTVQAYEQIFKAHLSDSSTGSGKDDTQGDVKPRYVRVNTLFISLEEAIEGFRDDGWKLIQFFDKTDYKGFLRKISTLSEDEFLIDIHVPNLLIFPPKTEFYNHPAYKNGSIVLQDKASCLPVHILNPPPGSVVLDMCAAPGMKTTQLAAVMNNQGTIYAVERNPKRFETLNRIIEASKATCIQTKNGDVLTFTPRDFSKVEYILVDPSCSGSGMTDRLDCGQKMDSERIQKLAGFQIKILRSALTRYPDVKRVVYSTCSVHPEENEDVVRQVLETNMKFKLVPAKQFVNDTWQNFGSSDYGEIGSYCLYAKPNEDYTNGFFVAIFERLEEGEENKFFNTKVYNYKRHVQSQENRRIRKQKAYEENAFDGYGNDDKLTDNKDANNSVDTTKSGRKYEENMDETFETSRYGFTTKEINESEENTVAKSERKRGKALLNDDIHEETKKTKQQDGNDDHPHKIESITEHNEDIPLNIQEEEYAKPSKKKNKKSKELSNENFGTEGQNRDSSAENIDDNIEHSIGEKVKKKKLKKDKGKVDASSLLEPKETREGTVEGGNKKKKKPQSKETVLDTGDVEEIQIDTHVSKKHKNVDNIDVQLEDNEKGNKKKRKSSAKGEENFEADENNLVVADGVVKKKKKKSKRVDSV